MTAPGRVDLDFSFCSHQAVRVVSLDDYIGTSRCPTPDYLKVDIDGSEQPFLKGAPRTLQSRVLKGIVFELHDQDPAYVDIVDQLNRLGFIEESQHMVEPRLSNIVFRR